MPKISLWVLLPLIFAIFIILSFAYALVFLSSPKSPKSGVTPPIKDIADKNIDMFFCEKDDDCISVTAGCCGCTGGGGNTTINKRFAEIYQKEIIDKCGLETPCPTVMSGNPTCRELPICIENQCQFRPTPTPVNL